MKKGAKLREDGYLLEIMDLDNEYWTPPGTYKSLRKAVADASASVHSMDTYLKVYRDFKANSGAYVGVFFSNSEGQPKQHLIVKISEFQLLTRAGIEYENEYARLSSLPESKAQAGR